MDVCRTFARTAVTLALVGLAVSARAGTVVLTNLDQPAQLSSPNPYVGQSFIAGNVDQTLYGAQMQLNAAEPPSQSILLEVEARNTNGTVGVTLFDNFSSSYNTTTGLITFTANSNFVLTAGTGYWLVLSDATKGAVNWDFTALNVYQSEFGYGLPSFDTAWISNQDNGGGTSTYYNPSDGPQLFALLAFTGSVVPEPSSRLLLCFPVAIAALTLWFHGARCGRPAEVK